MNKWAKGIKDFSKTNGKALVGMVENMDDKTKYIEKIRKEFEDGSEWFQGHISHLKKVWNQQTEKYIIETVRLGFDYQDRFVDFLINSNYTQHKELETVTIHGAAILSQSADRYDEIKKLEKELEEMKAELKPHREADAKIKKVCEGFEKKLEQQLKDDEKRS